MIIKLTNVTIPYERTGLSVYVNPDHIVDFYCSNETTELSMVNGGYLMIPGDKTAELAKIISTATNTKGAVLQ